MPNKYFQSEESLMTYSSLKNVESSSIIFGIISVRVGMDLRDHLVQPIFFFLFFQVYNVLLAQHFGVILMLVPTSGCSPISLQVLRIH